MAMYEVTGGGSKPTASKLGIGLGAGYGVSAPVNLWEEELERRRQELAKKQAQQRLTQKEKQLNPTWQAPTQQMKRRVEEARANLKPMTDPLAEYWQLSRKLGSQTALAKRLRDIRTLWNMYLKPSDGSRAILDLARSDFSLEEIESMCQAGHMAMYTTQYDGKFKVPAKLAQQLGIDPNDPGMKAQLEMLVANRGYLSSVPSVARSMPSMTPGWASGRTDDPENVDWLLEQGGWQNSQSGDIARDIEAVKKFENVRLESSSLYQSFSPEVQERLNYLWYQATGDPQQETPYGALDVEGKQVGWVRVSATDTGGWFPEGATKQEKKALQAALSLAAARFRAANSEEWTAEQKQREEGFRTALLFGVGGAGAGVAKGVAASIKGASEAARMYRGMRMTKHGLEAIAGPSGVATAAAGVASTAAVGGVPYAVMELAGGATQMLEQQRMEKIEQRMAPVLQALESPETLPQFAQELANMTNYAHGLPQTDAVSMQKQIQEGIREFNPDTDEWETIIGSYGKELEANGLWTWEWDQALSDFWADTRRYNVEVQRRLMESGYAGTELPVDGLIEGPNADPRWIAARDNAEKDLRAQMEFSEDHPLLSQFLQMTGIPITKQGAEAWVNRVFENGAITGLLSMLTLEPIKVIGGAYNGLLSTLTYGVIEDADEEYQRLKDEWLGAVEAGDPTAEEKKTALLQRQSQLLQNAFVPDPILAASVGFGKDVDDAIAWSQDHPNWVLALSLARDAALMRVTPAMGKVARGRIGVNPTAKAFLRSLQPNARIREMTGYIVENKLPLAERVVGGADAHTYVSTIEAVYKGKVRGAAAKFYDGVAGRLIQAADNFDIKTIEKSTTLRGGDAQGLAGRIRGTQADPGLAGQAALDSRRLNVARLLGKEQRTTKGLLDLERTAKEVGAEMWGEHAAIFPYLNKGFTDLPRGIKVNRKLISAIADVKNPALKTFLSTGIKQVQIKGMRYVPFDSVYGSQRVFSNALAAYGDVGKAMDVASRWVRNPRPSARTKIASQVKNQLAKKYEGMEGAEPPQPATGVDPFTGELISEGAVGLPTYLQYMADFGPIEMAMQAPLKVVKAMPVYEKVLKKYLINPSRYLERKFTWPSNVARQWTVALGPMLFVKHGITDSSRTVASVGTPAVFRSIHNGKVFEQNLMEMNAASASAIRYMKARTRASEQHFNVGNVHYKVDWSGQQMYLETRPGRFEPVNLARGVEALRRVASDEMFAQYIEGGEAGVRTWLYTKKGHDFMDRGRHVQDFKDNWGADGLTGLTKKQIYDAAVEFYIDRYVRGMLQGLEASAPQITTGLAQMVRGQVPLSERAIKNLVKEVNKNGVVENPYLSLPEEARAKSLHDISAEKATHLVGTWMTPNKLNRVATFNFTFNKVYREMKKSGAAPDEAGLVAAGIAEMNTGRIHFDLANALHIEAAHRWFAWFATKHRLYNTYLLKMATERPSIAGAAQTLYNWLEDRNQNKDLPDWDKHTIEVPVDWLPDWLPGGLGKKGASIRLNIDTIFWLSEYYTESSLGQLAEVGGAKILSFIPGVDIPYQISGFGISTGRWDRLVSTLGVVATMAPALDADTEITDEWVQEWFEGKHQSWMSLGAKQRIRKAMNVQQAAAMREGREMTPAQAFKAAVTGALFYEAIQMGKVWPGRIVSGDEEYYEDVLLEFNKLTPEERYNKLEEDPSIRFMFGIYSTNPVDQYSIAEGWRAVSALFKKRAVALEDALGDGTILDKNKVDSIYSYYDDEIDKVVNPDWRDPTTGEPSELYNETFAKVWTDSGLASMSKEEIFASMFPLCDPRAVTLEGYIPTRYQRDKEQDRLNEQFEEYCKANGLNYADSDDPRIKWLKEDLVSEPLRRYMRGQDGDGWTTNFANTVARDLARGEVGPAASAQFLTQIQNQETLKLYAKGTTGTAKAGVQGLPMFATMTVNEKEQIGWKSNKETELIWRLYCQRKAALDEYMVESGIGSSSSMADQLRGELNRWAEAQAEQHPGFRMEWNFSQSPLWKRLETLGVGNGPTSADEGWSAFLDVVNAYQNELSTAQNKYTRSLGVGATSQTAYPIAIRYAARLVELKRVYPDWWKQLIQTFGGLSKFGFVRWRSPDAYDDELWFGQETTIYEPPVIGGEE